MKKERCVWMICVLFCLMATARAQVITVENGVSVAKLKHGYEGQNLYPYQMSLGMEYMDRGWYNLSSQIGFLKKGGKTDAFKIFWEEDVPAGISHHRLHIRYLTMNTTFEIKTRSADGWVGYIGAGPRLDIYLGNSLYMDNDFRMTGSNGESLGNIVTGSATHLCPVVFGLKCVAGVKKAIRHLQIGLHVAYLPSFTKTYGRSFTAFHEGSSGWDRTFTVGVSLGYILPRDKHTLYSVRRTRNR